MTPSGGRHQRPEDAEDGPRRGTPRRGLLIGAGALGVLAVGGGAAAVWSGLGTGGDGASDGGGGIFGGSPAETTPPPVVSTLQDLSANVPDTSAIDLSQLSAPVSVTFPRVAGARGLSEAIDMSVNKLLREHVYSGAPAADLSVTGTLFVAGTDTLGALLRHTDASGQTPCVLYYRAAGDRPFTSPGLIAPEQWAALEQATANAAAEVDGLDAASLASALQEQPRPWGNGPAMVFAADGALHLLFPAALVDGQRTAVELPIDAATIKPLLSEDGAAVLAASAAPAGFDPATVSVPGDGSTNGDKAYVQPASVPAPARAREGDGTGPVAQLAPLSGAGVRPSSVAAPDATRLKAMSLTFDDGPDPDKNQTLRDALNERRAAATFYMIGTSVQAYPEWCAKTAANGLEVGSHSWSHRQLSALSGQKLTDQCAKPTEEIARAAGRAPFVMRPPYGARNDRVDAELGTLGQSAQIWDVDTMDWKTLNVAKNLAAIQNGTRRGSIALMHEIHQTSVDSVPQILEWLDQNDFTLLTASELGQNQMWAGRHYLMGLVTHEITPPAPPASDSGGAPAASDSGGAASPSASSSVSSSATPSTSPSASAGN